MEKLKADELEEKLFEVVLYNESTGKLHSPQERAEHLDVIRKNLVELSSMFEKIEEMDMKTRLVMISTFSRVVETYLEITKKHEALLEAGE